MKVERPYAYCCAEGGGNVEHCDCVNKDHGTAWFDAPTTDPVSREAAASETLLAEAAQLFRTYEAHHRAKIGEIGRPEKAERNAEIAGRIEAYLASPPDDEGMLRALKEIAASRPSKDGWSSDWHLRCCDIADAVLRALPAAQAGRVDVERVEAAAKLIAQAVMVWGGPHFKHIVSFNILCEAIEKPLTEILAQSAEPEIPEGVWFGGAAFHDTAGRTFAPWGMFYKKWGPYRARFPQGNGSLPPPALSPPFTDGEEG